MRLPLGVFRRRKWASQWNEFFNRAQVFGDRGIGELDESETARAARVTIHGNEDFTDLADLGEELLELGLRGRECEISYEQLGSDVDILLAIARPQQAGFSADARLSPVSYGISIRRATYALLCRTGAGPYTPRYDWIG